MPVPTAALSVVTYTPGPRITIKLHASSGFVGAMESWRLQHTNGSIMDVVIKRTPLTRRGHYHSCLYKNVREVQVYESMHAELAEVMPQTYLSVCTPLTGDYILVMEKIRGCNAGVVLGNQCWGQPESGLTFKVCFSCVLLPASVFPLPLHLHLSISALNLCTFALCIFFRRLPTCFFFAGRSFILSHQVDPFAAAKLCFEKVAVLHAAFWGQHEELVTKYPFLKASDWIQGRGQARWELGIAALRAQWQHLLQLIRTQKTSVRWSETVIVAVESKLDATSWMAFQHEIVALREKRLLTLSHGDFHGGNVLLHLTEQNELDPRRVTFVDWAEIAVWDPAVDCAQFAISNFTIKFRRDHEAALLDAYHANLVAHGVSNYHRSLLDQQYRTGGIDRWLSMLILMANMSVIPDFAVQWFHDQV